VAGAAVVVDPARWFSRVGTALDDDDQRAALAYLTALGLMNLEVRPALDASRAEAVMRDPAWDTRWWSIEEAERRRLTDLARKQHGLKATFEALSAAAEGQTELSFRQALAAAPIAQGDEGLARAAAGALSMALHGMALVRLADAGDAHVFVRKYALFSLGRWPLGVAAGALHLF
jgi:hypothetical protein